MTEPAIAVAKTWGALPSRLFSRLGGATRVWLLVGLVGAATAALDAFVAGGPAATAGGVQLPWWLVGLLFYAHKPRIYSVCLRMTNNAAEAEDLTQDAFLQVFRKLSTFRGDSALSTWLYRIAVNTVLMHFRKKGVRGADQARRSHGERQ